MCFVVVVVRCHVSMCSSSCCKVWTVCAIAVIVYCGLVIVVVVSYKSVCEVVVVVWSDSVCLVVLVV